MPFPAWRGGEMLKANKQENGGEKQTFHSLLTDVYWREKNQVTLEIYVFPPNQLAEKPDLFDIVMLERLKAGTRTGLF